MELCNIYTLSFCNIIVQLHAKLHTFRVRGILDGNRGAGCGSAKAMSSCMAAFDEGNSDRLVLNRLRDSTFLISVLCARGLVHLDSFLSLRYLFDCGVMPDLAPGDC